ncbi:MAG: tetratricopeptide repeat protein [Verrucomicrobia bacterium]|nr:tetratricopeptide repeat protein [Verrucomicrobiota bacterium]
MRTQPGARVRLKAAINPGGGSARAASTPPTQSRPNVTVKDCAAARGGTARGASRSTLRTASLNRVPRAPVLVPALPVRLPGANLLWLLMVLLVLLAQARGEAADATAAFDAANRLYAEGRFLEAAAAYEQILQSGQASAAVYFNLGNAHFKAGQMGRAIAAYRQAGQIAPRDPDLRANLQFARNQVQGPTVRPGRWEHWLGRLSLDEWAALGAFALWLTFALMIARELQPSLARSLRSWTLTAGMVTAVLIVCAMLAYRSDSQHRMAIVISPEAAVRQSPLEGAPNTFTARDGAELRVLDQKDDWLQVTDGTRRVGWVKESAVVVSGRS